MTVVTFPAHRAWVTSPVEFEIPRAVIKAVCNNYVDMAPDTIKEGTFCCGGGGGLLTDDLMELRVKGAQPRMQALHEVKEDHGVTHMAAICAICKAQFSKVLPYYDMGMDEIVSVHQLVSNAIVLTGQTLRDGIPIEPEDADNEDTEQANKENVETAAG